MYLMYTHIPMYRNKKVFLQNNGAIKKNNFSEIVATKHYGAGSGKVKTTVQS